MLSVMFGMLPRWLLVMTEHLDAGLVSQSSSAALAIAFVLRKAFSLTTELVLDAVAKSHCRQRELDVYRAKSGLTR